LTKQTTTPDLLAVGNGPRHSHWRRTDGLDLQNVFGAVQTSNLFLKKAKISKKKFLLYLFCSYIAEIYILLATPIMSFWKQ